MAKRSAQLKVYQDIRGTWRWRVQAGNGKIIADSGEGYRNLVDLENGIRVMKEACSNYCGMVVNDKRRRV